MEFEIESELRRFLDRQRQYDTACAYNQAVINSSNVSDRFILRIEQRLIAIEKSILELKTMLESTATKSKRKK